MAAATPFDDELASVSAKLDEARLYCGNCNARETASRRMKVGEASVSARARRVAFNTSAVGAGNFYGKNELLSDLEAGRVELEESDATELPSSVDSRRRFDTLSAANNGGV